MSVSSFYRLFVILGIRLCKQSLPSWGPEVKLVPFRAIHYSWGKTLPRNACTQSLYPFNPLYFPWNKYNRSAEEIRWLQKMLCFVSHSVRQLSGHKTRFSYLFWRLLKESADPDWCPSGRAHSLQWTIFFLCVSNKFLHLIGTEWIRRVSSCEWGTRLVTVHSTLPVLVFHSPSSHPFVFYIFRLRLRQTLYSMIFCSV